VDSQNIVALFGLVKKIGLFKGEHAFIKKLKPVKTAAYKHSAAEHTILAKTAAKRVV